MDVLAAGGFTMMADALKMNNLYDINGIFNYKHGELMVDDDKYLICK